MVKRATHERSEMLTNSKDVSSRTAAGIDAPGLRRGLAKRSPSASDLLVRVAGGMPGPAFGPAVLHPASVFFDFPGPFGLREPGTCGYGSRRTRFLTDMDVA
jgi:hypothetical protein